MNIAGQYISKHTLGGWKSVPQAGDAPSLRIQFEFPVLRGKPEMLAMWAMVDTGSDDVVVPGLAMGIELAPDGKTPLIKEESIASKLNLIPKRIKGIAGTTMGFAVYANVSLGGKTLPGLRRVVICDSIDFPLVGRSLLNGFAGVFCPHHG